MKSRVVSITLALVLGYTLGHATCNYHYGSDEYDTVMGRLSPDGKYAITSHGGGEWGYDDFHIYLTDVVKGKTIEPLQEIVGTLDTGAVSFAACWSKDSSHVWIV